MITTSISFAQSVPLSDQIALHSSITEALLACNGISIWCGTLEDVNQIASGAIVHAGIFVLLGLYKTFVVPQGIRQSTMNSLAALMSAYTNPTVERLYVERTGTILAFRELKHIGMLIADIVSQGDYGIRYLDESTMQLSIFDLEQINTYQEIRTSEEPLELPSLRNRITFGAVLRAPKQALNPIAHIGEGMVRSFLPFALVEVLSPEQPDSLIAGGKALVQERANELAVLEGLERASVASCPSSSQLLPYAAIAMHTSVSLTDLHIPETNPDPNCFLWTECRDTTTCQPVFVPADEVWLDLGKQGGMEPKYQNTTSGCALGSSLSEAAIHAAFELIERDAYLNMWYGRISPNEVTRRVLQNRSLRVLYERTRLEFPNYCIRFFRLWSDLPVPVVLATATRVRPGAGGKAFHACACKASQLDAAFSALQDLILLLYRPWGRSERSRAAAVAEDVSLIQSPDDHRLLFMLDAAYKHLEFLDNAKDEPVGDDLIAPLRGTSAKELLASLAALFTRAGLNLLTKDVSSRLISGDLHCVKTIAPSMYPMWYGMHNRRFRSSDRLQKISCLAGVLNHSCEPNTLPHPFS